VITTIYCNFCDRTYFYAVEGDDELLDAAGQGDPAATARLGQARADLLATHQMECSARPAA
jgi:hypothetical protein